MTATSYQQFFFNSKSSVISFECVELSHPNFSQHYYIVRNAVAGLTVTHEDSTTHTYTYYPVRIEQHDTTGDLDNGFTFTFGDLGTIIPAELDRVANANGFATLPTIKYRLYRSDDLTAPMLGPVQLQGKTFTLTKDGAAIEATALQVNLNGTGEVYTLDRFPMLKGFLWG